METQFPTVDRFRRLLPPGNFKPAASSAWKIYPTVQDLLADHGQLIREGDEAGAIESEIGGIDAIDVRHDDADIIRPANIGEPEFHCAIGRDVEVGQETILPAGDKLQSIAQSPSVGEAA